ncbi:MAG: LytTR family DNA-binding domain-containing protein [Heliomarina sp.]|uniref:LytTR family DNA-binding domain-containing protein n=1 Tax=Heliomarina sp. TaxID=2917556 RepID=UPI0040594D52
MVRITSWPRDWNPRERWEDFLALASIFLALVFTTLNPEPSMGLSALPRFIFWLAHILILLVLLHVAQVGLQRISGFNRLHAWVQVFVSGVSGTLLFTPVALMLEYLFFVDAALQDTAESFVHSLATEFGAVLPGSILVWFCLNATRLLRLPDHIAPDKPGASDPMNHFWRKVPDSLGRDLVALTAELHYLRVRTTEGDTLILYPFGRAVEELGDQGYRIHRSHWIAIEHLNCLERKGDRYFCRTDTGLRLPVSRSYLRTIRDACRS